MTTGKYHRLFQFSNTAGFIKILKVLLRVFKKKTKILLTLKAVNCLMWLLKIRVRGVTRFEN